MFCKRLLQLALMVSVTMPAAHAFDEVKPAKKAGASSSLPPLTDPPLAWKRMRQWKRFEEAVLREIKLDAKQRKTFQAAFADLYKRTHENPRLAALAPVAKSVYEPEELAKREAEERAAQAAGKTDEARRIHQEILEHTNGTDQNLGPTSDYIIYEMELVMTPKQLSKYLRVREKWLAAKTRDADDGPLRMIQRALNNPELGFSVDKFQALISETKKRAGKAPSPLDYKDMVDYGNKFRDKLYKSVTAEQRKIINADLNAFADEMRTVQEYSQRWIKMKGLKVPPYLKRPIPFQR